VGEPYTPAIGDRVRYRGQVGKVRELVEARPGRHRALVTFSDGEQFIDFDKIEPARPGVMVVNVATGETRPRARKGPLKHGLSRTPEYRAWQTMRHRCTNPNSPAWDDYGGRGITICAEWLDDPAAFIAHVGPRPSPKHEIDRIDNDKGYEPGNVRWATRSVNDQNRRSNHLIEFQGETLALVEWSRRTGINPDTIYCRIERGWSVERALTTPARAKAPNGSRSRVAPPQEAA
jgi:hypothetical protein